MEKIQATHLERRAVVYLRQSTLKQVSEHQESTVRQYALAERAAALGWPKAQIEVVDSDLGLSGSTTTDRAGYLHLAQDVAQGRVGAIFVLEVSRLSRSEADWYRLLDLCKLADVVIVDEQSVYAPKEHNDRLLLGLKGTMSEAEQTWMRLRLQGGALTKARRGELWIPPPNGYEWDAPSKKLAFCPNQEVQAAIRLLFDRFRIDSTATGVTRYLNSRSMKLPTRDKSTGELHWRSPTCGMILDILRNPIYTGAYVYGRSEHRRALVNGEIKNRQVIDLPVSNWKVLLKNHHPAYISWEDYMCNQKKLDANRANHKRPEQRGAPREGPALLHGILLCGLCGNRLRTTYTGHDKTGRYSCYGIDKERGDLRRCWTVPAKILDDDVAERFLGLASSSDIDLTLAVAKETERQVQELSAHWTTRLERARFEARHAERRYKAVDPDNRTVARTLERDWNEKLEDVARITDEMKQAVDALHLELTDEDRKRILEISKNLPLVWASPSTTLPDRKNLLRLAIQQISLTPIDVPKKALHVQIQWHGGAIEKFVIDRSHLRPSPGPRIVALYQSIRSFMEKGLTDAQITETLNQSDVRTSTNRSWTPKSLARFRERYGLRRYFRQGEPRLSHLPIPREFPRGRG